MNLKVEIDPNTRAVKNRYRSLARLQIYYRTRLRSLYKFKRMVINDIEEINSEGEYFVRIKTNLTNKDYNIKVVPWGLGLLFICPGCSKHVRSLYLFHGRLGCFSCLPICDIVFRKEFGKYTHQFVLHNAARYLAIERRLEQASEEERLILLEESEYYFRKVKSLLADPSLFRGKVLDLEKKYRETIVKLNKKLTLSNKLKETGS